MTAARRRSWSSRATAPLALALGATALLASCGGHAAPTSTPTAFPTTAAGARATGCGSTPPPSGVYVTTIDGRSRTFVVHVPSGYTQHARTPLVLNLHGSGATALDQEAFSGMDVTADVDDFLVVYPQGNLVEGTGFDWNVPNQPLVGGASVPSGAADDVAFLVALVHLLEQHYCVDTTRVDATGFSGGARMSSQLACDASSVFAAVAPVSGLRHPVPCATPRAVAVVAFHGTADPIDPYEGNGEAYWTYSVPDAAAAWGRQDGCTTRTRTPLVTDDVTLTTYARCHGHTDVELYAIAGEGHEWPGGPPVPSRLAGLLGPQSDAVDANAVMWAFFKAHPLP